MLGLVVLFFLGLWVLITLGATVIGGKIAGTKGAIIGFMLTMGGWFIYWAGEYVYIQYTVTKLCDSEGGLTVYVTPEQWREQIGEEEWANLIPYSNPEISNSVSKDKIINFEGRDYKYTEGIYRSGNLENARLAVFRTDILTDDDIFGSSDIIVNKFTGDVLLKSVKFTAFNKSQNLKFWIDNIQGCLNNNSTQFHNIAMQYSNTKKDK